MTCQDYTSLISLGGCNVTTNGIGYNKGKCTPGSCYPCGCNNCNTGWTNLGLTEHSNSVNGCYCSRSCSWDTANCYCNCINRSNQCVDMMYET